MTQRPSLSAPAVIEAPQIEAVLWAACPEDCETVGAAIVTAVATAVAYERTSDLELKNATEREATVELVACAAFVKAAANAFSVFSLRESRAPTTHELVLETAKLAGSALPESYALARSFIALRAAC